jgi:[ribosomal protein S18]-alanine N-acetyltransferase
MWLFRKSLDLSRATFRPVAAADLTHVTRLLRDGGKRYNNLSGAALPGALESGHGVVLITGEECLGVALVSWPAAHTCWLRALALADGSELRAQVAALMHALRTTLHNRGVHNLYYAGDEVADTWLTPILAANNFAPDTEMVVYEKRTYALPAQGNPDVQLRPATAVDLADVLRVDHACFEVQWTKDDTILGPAIEQGPFFLVAELDGNIVGYVYATTHFGGRLVHLVRIAVDPASQNQRIGVRLLAEVIKYAERHQADTITLNTQSYNAHAQRLYRWFGFKLTGERQPVLRMEI